MYCNVYITIFINDIMLSFCLFILFIVLVLYCYVHLRGVARGVIKRGGEEGEMSPPLLKSTNVYSL